jgi:ABC-type anion transport system duplicated permease subunit
MKRSEKIALILLAVIAAILFMAFFGQILTFFVGLLGVIGISGYALHSFFTAIDWRAATWIIALVVAFIGWRFQGPSAKRSA